MPTREDIVKQLRSYGGAPAGGFDQNANHKVLPTRTTIVADSAMKDVDISARTSEGYCTGVCIDWSRKVLQGGGPAYKQANVDRFALRHAAIQARLDIGFERSRPVLAVWDEINVLFQAALEKFNVEQGTVARQNLRKITVKQQIEASIIAILPDFQRAPGGVYDILKIKELLEILKDKAEILNQHTTAGWAAFVFDMNVLHMAYRMQRLKDPSKRPFNHIKILKCTDKTSYGNGSVKAALGSLVQLPEFVARSVMILGVDTEGTAGHAVAVYRWTDDKYMLFDPNFGVFIYYLRGLFQALLYLFAGYEEAGPLYKATGEVGYLLLGKAPTTI